jgi:hypothetical protein
MLKTIDKQLQSVDAKIDRHIDRHGKAQRELLDSVKCVGKVKILTLTVAFRAATEPFS